MERSKTIIKSGYMFILTNFLLAVFNLVVGIFAESVAITSDATHSLIDAISGFFVVFSEKALKKEKNKAKRDKVERLTTIAIAIIILAAGVHIVIESIEKICNPNDVEYSVATIVVLVGSVFAKLCLGIYLKKRGEKYKSKVLSASSAETMNDMLISIAVLVSIIVYFLWHVDIEAYISLFISVIIFKIGLEFIFPHLTKHHHHPLEQDPSHGISTGSSQK